jgi:hypothetical protein
MILMHDIKIGSLSPNRFHSKHLQMHILETLKRSASSRIGKPSIRNPRTFTMAEGLSRLGLPFPKLIFSSLTFFISGAREESE